jgi:hypothetical protein
MRTCREREKEKQSIAVARISLDDLSTNTIGEFLRVISQYSLGLSVNSCLSDGARSLSCLFFNL